MFVCPAPIFRVPTMHYARKGQCRAVWGSGSPNWPKRKDKSIKYALKATISVSHPYFILSQHYTLMHTHTHTNKCTIQFSLSELQRKLCTTFLCLWPWKLYKRDTKADDDYTHTHTPVHNPTHWVEGKPPSVLPLLLGCNQTSRAHTGIDQLFCIAFSKFLT